MTQDIFYFPCIVIIILSNLRSVKHSPEWYDFAYLNLFIKVFQNSCLLITKQPLNANIKQNNNFNPARSHFRDDTTKYPLRTPWHWRHCKRELFPAQLSTTSRPWFAIVIALSKSLAWHSSFVVELGPEKGVVLSRTIYFLHHCTSVSCRSFSCFEKSAKTQLQSRGFLTVDDTS